MLFFLIFCLSIHSIVQPAFGLVFGGVVENGEISPEIEKEIIEELSHRKEVYSSDFIWSVFNACAIAYIVLCLVRFSKRSKDTNSIDTAVDHSIRVYFESESGIEVYFAHQIAHLIAACGLKCSVIKVPENGDLLEDSEASGDATIMIIFTCNENFSKISLDNRTNQNIQFALFGIEQLFTMSDSARYHKELSRKFKEEGCRQLLETQIIHKNDPEINNMFYDWANCVVDSLGAKSKSSPLPLLTKCQDFGYYNKQRLPKRDWCDAVGENTHPWKNHEILTGTVLENRASNNVRKITFEINHYEFLGFQYDVMDVVRLVPKNNLESVLFICLRCGFDPNMVVEFSSNLPNLTLSFLPHISIRNLLLYYLDIHQPINKYMIDLLQSHLPSQQMEPIHKFCNENVDCNIVDILQNFEDLTLPLELLAELLPQVQNLPLRIISHDFSEGQITIIHDINYSDKRFADHSDYLLNLRKDQEVQLYFERCSAEIPHKRNVDVVLIADNMGAYSVVNILDKLVKNRIECEITVLVESTEREIQYKLQEYTHPQLTIYQGDLICDLIKNNSTWLRKVITMHNSFTHMNTSMKNSQKIFSVLVQSLCMSQGSSNFEDLNMFSMRRLMEQLCSLQKEKKFLAQAF